MLPFVGKPFLYPWLLATVDLFSISRVLPFPEYHTVCTFWKLASFTRHTAFEIHEVVFTSSLFLLIAEWYSVVWT